VLADVNKIELNPEMAYLHNKTTLVKLNDYKKVIADCNQIT
jgi:hypothetical protein